MKTSTVGVVAALVLGGLVVCSTMVNAQQQTGEKKGGKRGYSVEQQVERMTELLTLTEAQKPKVKEVLEKGNKERQEMFKDSSVPQDQRREKMQALMKKQDTELKAILTPAQFEKWQKEREQMRQKGGGKKKE
jgi:Spy/CpxP family protein refolding chaperone